MGICVQNEIWHWNKIPNAVKCEIKKNIENKKKIDGEGKFDARWDDKLKFFFKVP